MARYVILRDGNVGASAGQPAILAIRDGFSILAFVVSPLWLLWHRVWFAAILVIAATVALGLLAFEPAFAPLVLPANLALSLLVGLEGQSWRAVKAKNQGYTVVDVVDAQDRNEAELRFADPYLANAADAVEAAPVRRPAVPEVLYDVPAGATR